MILDAVMDEVAAKARTVAGLRVFEYPLEKPPPVPAAIVTYPDAYTFDLSYGRGSDELMLPVVVLAGLVSERVTRERIAGYLAGAGAGSLKAALEETPNVAYDTLRVASVEFDRVGFGGRIEYLAATFNLHIVGPGSS